MLPSQGGHSIVKLNITCKQKCVTPILHAIDNFKIYDIFATHIQPLIVSFVYFFKNFESSSFFVVIVLVQFCVTLVGNNVFIN